MSEDSEKILVGDRVKVFLDTKFWHSEGWFEGTVVRIDPYSNNRRFYWVVLDMEVRALPGGRSGVITVFDPKNIKRISSS